MINPGIGTTLLCQLSRQILNAMFTLGRTAFPKDKHMAASAIGSIIGEILVCRISARESANRAEGLRVSQSNPKRAVGSVGETADKIVFPRVRQSGEDLTQTHH